VALAAVFGLGLGLVCGVVVGELLGEVHRDRVRDAVRRLRRGQTPHDRDANLLERNLLSALRSNPTTRGLDLSVRIVDDGLVEVTGVAPDERSRTLAAALLESVRGTEVVVNRILVEGIDVNGRSPASTST